MTGNRLTRTIAAFAARWWSGAWVVFVLAILVLPVDAVLRIPHWTLRDVLLEETLALIYCVMSLLVWWGTARFSTFNPHTAQRRLLFWRLFLPGAILLQLLAMLIDHQPPSVSFMAQVVFTFAAMTALLVCPTAAQRSRRGTPRPDTEEARS